MACDEMAVVLFSTTQAAIRGEQVLQDAGVACKLIPTPRQISSECGLALRFSRADADRVRQLLDEAGVEHGRVYEVEL
jgi:hypothetical protein